MLAMAVCTPKFACAVEGTGLIFFVSFLSVKFWCSAWNKLRVGVCAVGGLLAQMVGKRRRIGTEHTDTVDNKD